MSTARQGRDVEHQARRQLDGAGYWTHRAAGSKGAVDIVALKPSQCLLVQCKRTGTMPPAEWNGLWDLASWLTGGGLDVVPVLARRDHPRRVPVSFWRLLAPKDGTPRRQPMELLTLDEPGEAP